MAWRDCSPWSPGFTRTLSGAGISTGGTPRKASEADSELTLPGQQRPRADEEGRDGPGRTGAEHPRLRGAALDDGLRPGAEQREQRVDPPQERETAAAGKQNMGGDRTSSFTNLAAVLGTGLVESMEADSSLSGVPSGAVDRHNINHWFAANAHLAPANNNNSDLSADPSSSYQRMTRHAACRLIGLPHTTTTQSQSQLQQAALDFPDTFPHNLAARSSRTGIAYSSQTKSQGANGNGQNGGRAATVMTASSASASSGFPTSLSSPDRTRAATASYKPQVSGVTTFDHGGEDNKEKELRRSTTPVQMFPGQTSSVEGQRRALPISRDIGMNVVEPSDGDSFFQRHKLKSSGQPFMQQQQLERGGTDFSDSNRSIRELERGMQNMWSPDAKEFKPAAVQQRQHQPSSNSANSSISDVGTDVSPRQAEMDLLPYTWNCANTAATAASNYRQHSPTAASRTLAILHAAWIRVPDVRAACEQFGVLESFRADFSSWGIFFVSYYDIRSAQYAAVELQAVLQRLSVMQRSSDEVLVRYCLSLSSSSQLDESQIVIADLPSDVNEYALRAMLSSYGALRSVRSDGSSYVVEFHNLQDTKQAMLELDSSQPWGPNVTVQVSPRDPMERQSGRELLGMIGRWRQGLRQGSVGGSQHGNSADIPMQRSGVGVAGPSADPWRSNTANTTANHFIPQRPQDLPQTQYILGPDGRYTQVIVQSAPATNFPPTQYLQGASMDTRHHQHVIQGPDGQIYIATTVPQQVQSNYHQSGGNNPFTAGSLPQIVSTTPYGDRGGGGGGGGGGKYHPGQPAYYSAHMVLSAASDANSLSGRSHRSAHSTHTDTTQGVGVESHRHLTLDVDAVELGQDNRTSLMVRNIPNKYTQQMLLSEFDENGHGPGVIDFFYLPIDFKNRCNRGYAFINFVEYKDILAFHRQYFGKHWRTFNSDKICDITYARIQGKEAMLKRFENSALMEKDDEYKPLVFVSDGARKGMRLPFPDLDKKDLHGRRFEV